MKKLMLGLCALLPVLAQAQSVEISTDHSNAVYACGAPATFTVRVVGADKQPVKTGRLTVNLSNFGPQVITNAVFDLTKGNPVTCTGKLEKPGILKCVASIKLDTNNCRAVFGAAYDPEKIVAGSQRPADFDAFWDAAVKKLDAEVPPDARVERLDKYCTDKVEAFRVSFATFDHMRVYGFLSVPKGKGPFGVFLVFRQMKRYPPHQVPRRILRLQPFLRSARISPHLRNHQRVQRTPQRHEHLRPQILPAAHRRNGVHHGSQIGFQRRGTAHPWFGRVAKRRKVFSPKLPPENRSRRQCAIQLPRDKMQKQTRRRLGSRRRKGSSAGSSNARVRPILPMEMTLRRETDRHELKA